MKNILFYIEETARAYPKNIAVADEKYALDYCALLVLSKKIGSSLSRLQCRNQPIAIFMDKSPELVAAMLGVAYSGNFYVVLDSMMPTERIQRIFETLQPTAVLTDKTHFHKAEDFVFDGSIFVYEKMIKESIKEKALLEIRNRMAETDPLYTLYTSGSTGQPKGTVISHRSVIAYTSWVIHTFDINPSTIFGSQTPFYFSMSITDLFGSLRTGARLQIIPKSLFSFPLMLVDYLNEKKINTLYWVPSALCIVANWKTFSFGKPLYLKKILFAGEVMPNKQLNYWRSYFPDAFFANLFGPTETTDICTYFVVNRDFSDKESLPIGIACDNCKLLVLDENRYPARKGELFVGGPFLANGYYNNPEKTKQAFIQNPCNSAFPEIVYKTGDLVSYNEYDELIYLGRKDFQIKHMGYRIELGEIESNVSAIKDVNSCVCIYDTSEDKIVLLYQGKTKSDLVMDKIRSTLPSYMHPNEIKKLKQMPYNANGKIDRAYLKKEYKNL